jgi:hypothetical protein
LVGYIADVVSSIRIIYSIVNVVSVTNGLVSSVVCVISNVIHSVVIGCRCFVDVSLICNVIINCVVIISIVELTLLLILLSVYLVVLLIVLLFGESLVAWLVV